MINEKKRGMYPIQLTILPPPAILKNDVECVRIADYSGGEAVAIKVAPTGLPGMVFHQSRGQAALEQIVTASGRTSYPPPFFLYGPVIEPSVMAYTSAAFTVIQVILKPYALKTLFGLNASRLAPGWADLHEFWHEDLTGQLMEARNGQEQMTLLSDFLVARLKQEHPRDPLVEESLRLIHTHSGALHVRDLLDALSLSERQFERRFTQAVGLTPQVYLRVKRFNGAIRLIKTRRFARLTDVAFALNFSDQSHLIHDIRTFAGMTPTRLAHQVDDFYHDQAGYSFV
jgi:AraC-like DNA-binding protein